MPTSTRLSAARSDQPTARLAALLGSRGPHQDGPRPHGTPPRPLVLVAGVGGVAAASIGVTVAMALGIIGWFLADSGSHGQPSDGMRIGALVWLMGHGSTIHVQGVLITAIPLLVTAGIGWSIWRSAHRVGVRLSGYGPDAQGLANGDRDWTVPIATGFFATGYTVVTCVVGVVASTASTSPDLGKATWWALVLSVGIGGAGVAIGSGRMAMWVDRIPTAVRAAVATAAVMVKVWWILSALLLLISLATSLGDVANTYTELKVNASGGLALTALAVSLLPNAALFSSAWLAGPGFAVGIGTSVQPGLVHLGALPVFPLVPAIPTGDSWSWVVVAPYAVAVVVVARRLWGSVDAWTERLMHGCGSGLVAAVIIGIATSFAGGSVGPSRLQEVGPATADVTSILMLALGGGGLVGAAVTVFMSWLRERGASASH